jgi:hypothetical protein
MKPKTNAGLGVLAVAGVLLAIRPLKNDINDSLGNLPDALYTACLIGGVILAAVGLSILLFPSGFFSSLAARLFKDFDEPDFDCRPAKRSELEFIHDFSSQQISGNVSPLPQMVHFHKKNRSVFWVLINKKSAKDKSVRKKVGYYSVLPLSESARKLLEREELNGLKLTTEHILKQGETPAAIYIGGIAARRLPFRSRAVLLSYLKAHINRERERGVSVAYSRPVTKDGLRILRKYGFSPVADLSGDELDRIYKIVIPAQDSAGPDNQDDGD